MKRFLTLALLVGLALTAVLLLNASLAAATGSAVVYSVDPDWVYQSTVKGSRLGYSIGTAGDVNGDGYDDVIVGAPQYTFTENEGAAFVFYGSSGGLSSTPALTIAGGQKGSRFGASVGTAGDVNGDGYDDVIVGAPEYGQPAVGRAYVFAGSESGLITTTYWVFDGDRKDAQVGCSVGTAGDVNGDDYDDVIVGAQGYSGTVYREGAAFVFLGSASGLTTTVHWMAVSGQSASLFGTSVGTAGDVNGDGYADVIVGASQYNGDYQDEGAAFVYYGSDVELSATADWTAYGDQADAEFGTSVGVAGLTDGDIYSDVIVGAPGYYNGEADEGAAFVFRGSDAGLSATYGWMVDGDQGGSRFGISVGTAGDVNGDGYADVIVGAYKYDGDQSAEGAAYIFHGSSAGLFPFSLWRAEGDKADTEFGHSVGTAGDVNGDGYDDVIVGAPEYRFDEENRGRAFGYYGPIAKPKSVYLPLLLRTS